MDRRNFISTTILATAAGAATVAAENIVSTPITTTKQNPSAVAAAVDEPTKGQAGRFSKMRTITMEEHYISPAFIAGPGKAVANPTNPKDARSFKLACDLGPDRIALMDSAGIDVQILSHAPGIEEVEGAEQVTVARETNDYLLHCVAKYPTRYGGFASLPTASPDKAAQELERMVKLGFKGAIINGHTHARYLDDTFFWPILESAQSLKVPIYLHPTPPPKAIRDVYFAGFSPGVSQQFAQAGWGWHIETAVHVLRMGLGGVFDRFPDLQIVVGHMGETLSFMLPRINRNLPMELTKLKRPMAEYLRENIYYTFAGFNFPQNFMNLMQQVGVDRIMFSVDHPYGSMVEARTFLDQLPISPADRNRIAHKNAERLFKI